MWIPFNIKADDSVTEIFITLSNGNEWWYQHWLSLLLFFFQSIHLMSNYSFHQILNLNALMKCFFLNDSCPCSQLQTSPEYGQGMNPISRLAQIQQAKKEKEPEYTLVTERGLPRRREFVMQVLYQREYCSLTQHFYNSSVEAMLFFCPPFSRTTCKIASCQKCSRKN